MSAEEFKEEKNMVGDSRPILIDGEFAQQMRADGEQRGVTEVGLTII